MKYDICTLYIATVTKLCHVTNHSHLVRLYDAEVGTTPSFLARHMIIRYFMMLNQVESSIFHVDLTWTALSFGILGAENSNVHRTVFTFYTQYAVSLRLVSLGHGIWIKHTNPIIRAFVNLYCYRYSALPTNSQFTERGMNESGYFSLGHCSEKNRSALAITRDHLIPDAIVIKRL